MQKRPRGIITLSVALVLWGITAGVGAVKLIYISLSHGFGLKAFVGVGIVAVPFIMGFGLFALKDWARKLVVLGAFLAGLYNGFSVISFAAFSVVNSPVFPKKISTLNHASQFQHEVNMFVAAPSLILAYLVCDYLCRREIKGLFKSTKPSAAQAR